MATPDSGDGGGDVRATVTGNVSGQVAVGTGNVQHQVVGGAAVTGAELAELRALLAAARRDVADQAPADKRGPAIERLDELDEAIDGDDPDLLRTTVEYVKRWFTRQLPDLAGTVVGVLVHPVLGRIVAAAGGAVADRPRKAGGD